MCVRVNGVIFLDTAFVCFLDFALFLKLKKSLAVNCQQLLMSVLLFVLFFPSVAIWCNFLMLLL